MRAGRAGAGAARGRAPPCRCPGQPPPSSREPGGAVSARRVAGRAPRVGHRGQAPDRRRAFAPAGFRLPFRSTSSRWARCRPASPPRLFGGSVTSAPDPSAPTPSWPRSPGRRSPGPQLCVEAPLPSRTWARAPNRSPGGRHRAALVGRAPSRMGHHLRRAAGSLPRSGGLSMRDHVAPVQRLQRLGSRTGGVHHLQGHPQHSAQVCELLRRHRPATVSRVRIPTGRGLRRVPRPARQRQLHQRPVVFPAPPGPTKRSGRMRGGPRPSRSPGRGVGPFTGSGGDSTPAAGGQGGAISTWSPPARRGRAVRGSCASGPRLARTFFSRRKGSIPGNLSGISSPHRATVRRPPGPESASEITGTAGMTGSISGAPHPEYGGGDAGQGAFGGVGPLHRSRCRPGGCGQHIGLP